MNRYRYLSCAACFVVLNGVASGCSSNTAPVSDVTGFRICQSDGDCRNGQKPSCATGSFANLKCVNNYCTGFIPTAGTTCFPPAVLYCDYSGQNPDCDPPADGGLQSPSNPSACGTRECTDNGAGLCTFGTCLAP
jgi:hypothetical protein